MRIVMGNDPSLTRTMPNGETWFQCQEVDGFIVGAFGRDPDFGGSISLRWPDGHVTRWLGYTPHPPRLTVKDGIPYVAISGIDPPAPDAVPWADAFPPLPAPTWPDMPDAPDDLPPLWIGGDCSRGGLVPGNCAWSYDPALPDDRPVTEMSPYAAGIGNRPLLMGLWLSDNGADPASVAPEIAFAKSRNASAVYLHCDDVRQWPAMHDAAARVTAAGLTPIWGTQVSEGRTTIVDGATPLWGLTCNIRTQGKDPEAMKAAVLQAIEAARTVPRCAGILIFGWHQCEWPGLKDYLVQVIHATPTPAHFPGVVEPPVQPEPPFIDNEQPPKVNTHPGIGKGKTAAAIALVPAVATFVSWLVKKLRRRHG